MPAPADPATFAADLRLAILKLARRVRQTSREVSVTDAQLIAIIDHRPGIGVSELANLERVSAPSMSLHIKRLEGAGWIVRIAAKHDRRRMCLTLTAAGRELLQSVRQSRNDWLATHLARLDAGDQAAIANAIGPLNRLLDAKP